VLAAGPARHSSAVSSSHDPRITPTSISMPGLLDLPSELLFDIISLVDASPYPPVSNQKRYRPARLQSRAVVCFPTTDPSWPSHTRHLLYVCRKLHYETSVYLSKAPQSFQVDVAIVDNHWIWPTWKYIPAAKNGYLLESLEVNLIHCCSEDERGSSGTDSANYTTSLEFLKVVGHFLRCGVSSASFEGTGLPKRRSNFRVKNITINVDTASIRPGNEKLNEEEVSFRQVQGLAHLSFDSLYFVDSATCLENLDRLSAFINMALPRVDDGLTLRERVDRIVFSADGQTRSELNIAKHISGKEESRIAEYRRRSST
jgi:hypothetical protein